ncbi:MAG TPA: dNTP triphosphohydrolase [Candidatus Cloacimonadota bacterium]|nr:dNTP triphosphohydrolase [Candidatus Cloacimonadota bacterium]
MQESIFAANPKLAKRDFRLEETQRSNFQRDRDRILYSREFRRLAGKTQVIVSGFNDDIRSRLTHSLEVMQIAKSIGYRLGLNMDLIEAISLGHDLGHTPFGHVGERVLHNISCGCENLHDYNLNLNKNEIGFKHNWQGLRICKYLAQIDKEYDGLDLTDYTVWGILNHTSTRLKKCESKLGKDCRLNHHQNPRCLYQRNIDSLSFYNTHYDETSLNGFSFEGMVVRIADELAQRQHDIEDCLNLRIVDNKRFFEHFKGIYYNILTQSKIRKLETISQDQNVKTSSHQFSTYFLNMVIDECVSNIEKKLKSYKEKYHLSNYKQSPMKIQEMVYEITFKKVQSDINLPYKYLKCDEQLREFVKNSILHSANVQEMDGKAKYIIKKLFKAYLSEPTQMSNYGVILFNRNLAKEHFDILYRSPKVDLSQSCAG